MRNIVAVILAALALGAAAVGMSRSDRGDIGRAAAQSPGPPPSPPPPLSPPPQYAQDGSLILPEDFRNWVFVGASLGLGYSQGSAGSGPGMFHNVYLHPTAYEHFAKTGEFPEKTMLALAMYSAGRDAPPRGSGFYEGDFVTVEIALKDNERFEEGWAYYNFSAGGGELRATAQRIPPAAGCNGCHSEHGAQDNVFLQFYPVLRRLKGMSDAS